MSSLEIINKTLNDIHGDTSKLNSNFDVWFKSQNRNKLDEEEARRERAKLLAALGAMGAMRGGTGGSGRDSERKDDSKNFKIPTWAKGLLALTGIPLAARIGKGGYKAARTVYRVGSAPRRAGEFLGQKALDTYQANKAKRATIAKINQAEKLAADMDKASATRRAQSGGLDDFVDDIEMDRASTLRNSQRAGLGELTDKIMRERRLARAAALRANQTRKFGGLSDLAEEILRQRAAIQSSPTPRPFIMDTNSIVGDGVRPVSSKFILPDTATNVATTTASRLPKTPAAERGFQALKAAGIKPGGMFQLKDGRFGTYMSNAKMLRIDGKYIPTTQALEIIDDVGVKKAPSMLVPTAEFDLPTAYKAPPAPPKLTSAKNAAKALALAGLEGLEKSSGPLLADYILREEDDPRLNQVTNIPGAAGKGIAELGDAVNIGLNYIAEAFGSDYRLGTDGAEKVKKAINDGIVALKPYVFPQFRPFLYGDEISPVQPKITAPELTSDLMIPGMGLPQNNIDASTTDASQTIINNATTIRGNNSVPVSSNDIQSYLNSIE